MEHITRELGLGFLLRRRKNVFLNEDAFVLKPKASKLYCCKDADCSSLSFDDTATDSSVSTFEDESFSMNTVSFAETVVTEVYERPRTSLAERRDMFYSNADFRVFRREYYTGAPEKDINVKFTFTPTVHEYERDGDDEELYYSPSELQTFLDDFLKSLQA